MSTTLSEPIQTERINKKSRMNRVIFHRFNWSYLASAIILLILPIFNYPLTSKYGLDYEFRFFLDPELFSVLDFDRNLMEFGVPLPIYIFMGVLPGVLGLVLILYILLSSFPHFMYINQNEFDFYETKVFIPIKNRFSMKNLQAVDGGKKRLSSNAWLFFFGLLFLASIYWYYGFDSVLNNGSWYYFQIEQMVWDGEELAGTINLGVQLFGSILMLIAAGLLLVVVPRKDMIIETNKGTINFAYSFITMKTVESNSTSYSNSLTNTFKYLQIGSVNSYQNAAVSKPDTIESSNEIVSQLVSQATPKYVPKLKILLYSAGLISVITIQLIPGFFFGDFLIPFGVVGIITFLRMLLHVFFRESYNKQTFFEQDVNLGVFRSNFLSGKRVDFIVNPQKSNIQRNVKKLASFESIIGGFMIWEILIVVFNMIEFIKYFITSGWTIVHLSLCIFYVFILVYTYFERNQFISLEPSVQRMPKGKFNFPKEEFCIIWEEQERSIKDDFDKWQSNLKKISSTKEWLSTYKFTLVYFAVPFVLFIAWMILYFMSTMKFFVYIFI